MRFHLFIGLAVAVVLSVMTVALAGGFTMSSVNVASEQPCCTADCCPECIACCAIDGCCEECIQCCIDMGCDPSCCLPTTNVESAKKVGASRTQPVSKDPECCAGGCCN